VAQQFLDGAAKRIVPCFQQVGGKRVTKGVAADRFVDIGLLRCFLDGFL